MSEDLSIWTQAVTGQLEDFNDVNSCADTKFFPTPDVVQARYVRFRDIDFYKSGPALALFEPVEPSNSTVQYE